MTTTDLEVVPLTPARTDDWLAFFDGPAFADNREWGTCYCRCFVFGAPGEAPKGRDAWSRACDEPGENRAAMVAAVRGGQIDGLLARRGGETVGWLHFGPSERFCSPLGPLARAAPDRAAIVCFVVAAPHRRTGVARALLRRACEEARARGFQSLVARAATDASASAAEQFTGPLSLYLSEGFALDEALAEGTPRVWVARALP